MARLLLLIRLCEGVIRSVIWIRFSCVCFWIFIPIDKRLVNSIKMLLPNTDKLELPVECMVHKYFAGILLQQVVYDRGWIKAWVHWLQYVRLVGDMYIFSVKCYVHVFITFVCVTKLPVDFVLAVDIESWGFFFVLGVSHVIRVASSSSSMSMRPCLSSLSRLLGPTPPRAARALTGVRSQKRAFTLSSHRLAALASHPPSRPTVLIHAPSLKDVKDLEYEVDLLPPEQSKINITDQAAEVC